MGADDYLTKPFQEVELLNAIESRLKKIDNLSKAFMNTQESIEEFYQKATKQVELSSLSIDRKVNIVKKKQIIYSEGDEPLRFFFLKMGKVKTFQSNRDGKEFITGLYNSGDFFGHIAIIENSEYQESSVALEECEIIGIPKQDFLTLITHNQLVANQFIKMLANDIQEKEKQLMQIAYNSIRKRTADALIMLSKKYKKVNQPNFTMKISRDDLASVVGTATESLIRTLSDFKADNLIAISGSEITILDEKKLINLR
jgi:CRP-like cAMP-binding protein